MKESIPLLAGGRIAFAVAVVVFAAEAHGEPCTGMTQMEMNRCAEEQLHRDDAAMARAYQAAQKRFDEGGRKALADAQEAWSRFRVAECEARTWLSSGGSMHRMQIDYCFAELARDRAVALAALPER